MSDFLEKLKKAADTGEFNSDIAKKINEINEAAEEKLRGKDVVAELEKIKENLEKRVEEDSEEVKEIKETKPLVEEDVIKLNTEYEKKMQAFKKQDAVNRQLATLIDIEDMVKLSIEDMFSFIEELDTKFEKEFDGEDKMYADLFQKIQQINSKYKSIIN